MDKLQTQISELNYKVDRLQEIVERIGNRIVEISEADRGANSDASTSSSVTKSRLNSNRYGGDESVFNHKDILIDDGNSKTFNSSNEQSLSPEIQIRRLTAQLTAAYNRIAALEEQLLACRIQS